MMSKSKFNFRLKNFRLIFILLVFISFSSFEILDKDKFVKFFQDLAEALDRKGIDIVQDWNSTIYHPGRPILAPLANYPASVAQKESKWVDAFRTLYANALIGVKTTNSVNASNFLNEWNNVPSENRVFVSCTANDVEFINIISKVLEGKGYKVFTYVANNDAVFRSPEMVVNCMKTAGQVLVIDTKNARSSVGVIAETLAYSKYSYLPESDIIKKNELLKEQIKNKIEPIDFTYSQNDLKTNIKSMIERKSGKYFNTYEESVKFYKNKTGNNPDLYTKTINYEPQKKIVIDALTIKQSNETIYETNSKMSITLNKLNSISTFSSLLSVIEIVGICPYYHIPIALCPICSKSH